MWTNASADASRRPSWATRRMPGAGGAPSSTASLLNAALFMGAATSAPCLTPAFPFGGPAPGVGPSGPDFGGAGWWSTMPTPPPLSLLPRAADAPAIGLAPRKERGKRGKERRYTVTQLRTALFTIAGNVARGVAPKFGSIEYHVKVWLKLCMKDER